MRPKSSTPETPSERLVRDIRRATRKQYSAEEKIRIVLDGLQGGFFVCAGAFQGISIESKLFYTFLARCRMFCDSLVTVAGRAWTKPRGTNPRRMQRSQSGFEQDQTV